jgi:hypothetical protein
VPIIADWKVAKKTGNKWCDYRGFRVTIFTNDYGEYRWCVAGPKGVQWYSRGEFETEQEAIKDVLDRVDRGHYDPA